MSGTNKGAALVRLVEERNEAQDNAAEMAKRYGALQEKFRRVFLYFAGHLEAGGVRSGVHEVLASGSWQLTARISRREEGVLMIAHAIVRDH